MFSIMDLMVKLNNSEAEFVAPSTYNRISTKTVDKMKTFIADDFNSSKFDFVFSEEALNMSMRLRINGHVNLGTRGLDVGLPEKYNCFKYKTYSIIKDGKLNMESFKILVDSNLLNELKNLCEFTPLRITVLGIEAESYLLKVDISDLAIFNEINEKEVNNIDDLVDLQSELNKLKAHKKVLKMYIEKLEENSIETKGEDSSGFTSEMINVLREFGVGSHDIYSGDTEEKKSDEYYISRQVIFQIKGESSIPSVNAALKKMRKGKSLNSAYRKIFSGLGTYARKSKDIDALTQAQLDVINRMKEIKIKLGIVKISRTMSNNWFKEFDVSSNGDLTYTNESDVTLKVKIKRVKQYV